VRTYVLSALPTASRPWVESLLESADDASLSRFVQWHGADSLRAMFARLPPWAPPDWRTFIDHCLPDWVPVVQRVTTYLPPDSFERHRDLAWDIAAGASSAEEAAYRVFWWVGGTVAWSPEWGTATPIEIIARRRGSSLHIAQVVTALCRALFIPARLVEEVALIPPIWHAQAKQVWRQAPPMLCRWLGARSFYHPACEIQVAAHWQPVDAQRAQFGRHEVQQHLRVPDLLKLTVNTWQDYGRSISRTPIYTTGPLLGKQRDASSLTFRRDLALIGKLVAGRTENAGVALDGVSDLLDRIQARAGDLWLRRPRSRTFALVANERTTRSALLHLRAVAPAPLAGEPRAPGSTVPARTTLLLLGDAVTEVLAAGNRELLAAGGHLLALYESWGAGERAIRRVLSDFGGDLADWSARPGDPQSVWQVRGKGCLARHAPWTLALDLRVVRLLRPPVGADGAIVITEKDEPHSPRIVCATLRVGKGRLTFAPISLASLADPYSVAQVPGCHRRLLGALLQPRES